DGDVVVDVAVVDDHVEEAVEIVVEEGGAEAGEGETGRAETADGGTVLEGAVAAVAPVVVRLRREVGDEEVEAAVAVDVARIDGQGRRRAAVLFRADAGSEGDVAEATAAEVLVEAVDRAVVGDEQVGPAVVVVVEEDHPETLAARFDQPGIAGDVGEGAV